MTGQVIKKVLLTEAVYSKAPSTLTSALLAEPSEDEANARHLDIICHGKFTDACKTSIQIRGQCVVFVFETKFVATKSSQVSLKFTWRFLAPLISRLQYVWKSKEKNRGKYTIL